MTAIAIERELRRDPEAWDSWLVYADWLAERGDVRGRRIGLAHRRESSTLGVDDRARIDAEIAELDAEHESAWDIPDTPDGCVFERRHGFIVGAVFPLGADLLEPLAALLQHPQARLLASLRLIGWRDPDEDEDYDEDPDSEPEPLDQALLDALFGLPLAGLRSFAIEYLPLGSNLAGPLADCRGFGQLRELDLRGCWLGTAAAQALGRAEAARELEALWLHRNRLAGEAMRGLLAGRFDRLRLLDLRDNPLGLEGAATLAAADLPALETLYLHRDDVGLEGAGALSRSTKLPLHIRRYWAGQWSASHESTPR